MSALLKAKKTVPTIEAGMSIHIEAVSVNHNTSRYMELMLRSLFARQHHPLSLTLSIYDNASTDDVTELRRYAERVHVPILQSGFPLAAEYNSHGEILRHFVLERPDCSHYLFLDADVCFIEDDTLQSLLQELDQHPDAFGIGPRMSWDGKTEIPLEVRQANPDMCDARLHPACALMPNTLLFRQLAESVGFSAVNYLWAMRAEYRDTMKLFTQAMHAFGKPHVKGSPMIQHFFAVSYKWDSEETIRHKTQMRDRQLQAFRRAH